MDGNHRVQSVTDFLVALSELPVDAVAQHVLDDVASLRTAFADQEAFLRALQATTDQLEHAVRNPFAWGKGMTEGAYAGWRRSAFPSERGRRRPADLRLVFRPADAGGVELLAFGHRWLPQSLYRRARGRRSS